MRVLAEKYGWLHVNVFHNRLQFVIRKGRRCLSIVYRLNWHSGDRPIKSMTIPLGAVRAIFRRAFALKRWQRDQAKWIPGEVLAHLESQWGIPALRLAKRVAPGKDAGVAEPTRSPPR
jgi:hypothetical protein